MFRSFTVAVLALCLAACNSSPTVPDPIDNGAQITPPVVTPPVVTPPPVDYGPANVKIVTLVGSTKDVRGGTVTLTNPGGSGFVKVELWKDASSCLIGVPGVTSPCTPDTKVGETASAEVVHNWQQSAALRPAAGKTADRVIVYSRDPGSLTWRQTDSRSTLIL